jgi:hypothetical protein
MVGFGASTSDYVDVGRLPSGYGVCRISLGARRSSGHDKCDRSENRNRRDGYAATVTLDSVSSVSRELPGQPALRIHSEPRDACFRYLPPESEPGNARW